MPLVVGVVVVAAALILIQTTHGPAGVGGGSGTASPTMRPPATQSSNPTTTASGAAAASAPGTSSSGTAQLTSPATCAPTDKDQYVYHPQRLEVSQACIRVTGVVAEIRTEADGDLHILLGLDAPFAHLLTLANQGVERGDLVIEPICVRPVTQLDAMAACRADPDPLTVLPRQGDYVWMEGRYVFDLQHGGWAELHPLYRWGHQDGSPIPAGSPTPGFSPAGGCSPAYPTVCIPPPPPDLNCSDIPFRRFKVLPPDPHHFDGNNNGIGCESG